MNRQRAFALTVMVIVLLSVNAGRVNAQSDLCTFITNSLQTIHQCIFMNNPDGRDYFLMSLDINYVDAMTKKGRKQHTSEQMVSALSSVIENSVTHKYSVDAAYIQRPDLSGCVTLTTTSYLQCVDKSNTSRDNCILKAITVGKCPRI